MTRHLAIFGALLLLTSPALAHSAERGFVLLLPTGFIIAGGAAVVALTFVIMALLRDETVQKLFHWQTAPVRVRLPLLPLRLIALALMAFALFAGFTGSNDPARNILPLSVWIGFWVVFVLLHPFVGNLAVAVNPFQLIPNRDFKTREPPSWSGWPAFSLFGGFAWFQLVYPAPENPRVLGLVILAYLALTAIACITCVPVRWLGWGDAFALLFRMFARVAPLRWSNAGQYVGLAMPGSGLVQEGAVPRGVTFFLVLVLSAISFDALAATFWWQSLWGINPLEYPGRTAMIGANTFGLAASFLVLLALLWLATRWGIQLSGSSIKTDHLLARFTLAMLPISVAFHFSHYLTELLVNGQYLVQAWAHAFGLGDGHAHVTTSFLNTAQGAWTIYGLQTASIVAGHIISIAVAHAMALDEGLRGRTALKLEIPMAILMVAYTGFGLWLLSTPTIA